MSRSLVLFLFTFLTLHSCEKDDNLLHPADVGDLKVSVSNEFGQPIEGAKITVGNIYNNTDSNGVCYFRRLTVKEYEITVSKQSFLPRIQKIMVVKDIVTEFVVTLNTGDAFLNISESIRYLAHEEGSFNVEIQSNAEWKVETTSSWLESSIQIGAGNDVAKISYLESLEDTIRTDSILFISDTIVKRLLVKQHFPIKLIEYHTILGDDNQGIQDSVYVLFNKPISVNTIHSQWPYCQPEMNYVLTNDKKGVLFSFNCAELGGSYPFSISVSDDAGSSATYEIDAAFYDAKCDIEGYISDILFINQDKEVLISTFNPSRIVKYSIESDSIIQTYDLSSIMAPIHLVYNTYNSKVYLMGNSDPNAVFIHTNINSPYVYTLNHETGEISLAFISEPDEEDHPQYPAIVPFDIGFTRTGLGVLLLKANESSQLRWKLIDSSKNDSIYKYPYYNDVLHEWIYFNSVHLNYDGYKLYLTRPSGSVEYGIFDALSSQISLLLPSSNTQGHTITANRKQEKFYARQLYSQFIIDLSGNMSQISYMDSRHKGKADFSYRENEENTIYLCESQSFESSPNRFVVLDYNLPALLKTCDVIEDLQGFSTTIDGSYAVAYRPRSGEPSSLYVFRTETFHSHVY
jgi:hypothetical protein